MNADEIKSVESALNLDLPKNLRDFLSALDHLPQRLFREGAVLRFSKDIIELNRRLRAVGYYHLPWLTYFLAVGSDPGDCIYYFDLSTVSCAVFFADHDLDDFCEYKMLAPTPEDFTLYLHQMLQDWERQDAEVR